MSFSFFASIRSDLNPFRIADIYRAAGWSIRKSQWDGYEATTAWSEVEIESDGSVVLVHGSVAGDGGSAMDLVTPLRAANLEFSAEIYGPDGKLIDTLSGP